MNKIICDRCGTDKQPRRIKLMFNSRYVFGMQPATYDLCDDCERDFFKFLSKREV